MSEEFEVDKDILDDFVQESNGLLDELSGIVEKLEDFELDGNQFPKELLEDFSQKIDRIMGASKTISMMAPDHLGLQRISKISELCKGLGYAAAQSDNPRTIPIFAGFWADTLEVVEDLMGAIEDKEKTEKIVSDFSSVLQGRLEWLSGVLKPIRAFGVSESTADPEADAAQARMNAEVDALLAELLE